uniref:Major facilitator superfamily (MFS) profile domain-containing protein n=1 Tax=Acrobeloides nanus TaxID=290746 RepID=A0A914DBR9_9BILA
MAPPVGSSEKFENPYGHPIFNYTQEERSFLQWAVAAGSIIGTFPFNWLYVTYGARYVFFGAGIASTLATLAIPISAQIGIWCFIAVRFIQGFAYAANFASIGVLCSRWSSLKQMGFFLAVLTNFTPMSTVVTNIVSGQLCESQFGWPAVYYVHGVGCLILFTLWIIFYNDFPERNKRVSAIELEKIHRNKSQAHIQMDSFVPYWEILKNPVILTVWLNSLADIFSGVFLLLYAPTYFKNVLKFGVAKTGFLSAMPALSHIFMKWFCGYVCDKIKCISEKSKLIAFNSIALLGPALCYALLGYVPDSLPYLAFVIAVLKNTFIAANCGGFYKCAALHARQYSHFVVGNIQFTKCLSLFLAPALVAIFITDDSSRAQWRTIFLILAATLVISNFIFCFMCSDQPAEFTKITRESIQNGKTNKISDASESSTNGTSINVPLNEKDSLNRRDSLIGI